MNWWCSATGEVWSWTWRAYPGVWLFVLLVAFVGWRRAGRVRAATGRPVSGWRSASWAGACLVLWLALDWPIGALGAGYLVSLHTVQYLLLTFFAAPLLLLGWRFDGGEPGEIGGRGKSHAVPALLLYTLILMATHLPAVVDRLMPTQWGAALVDLAWLAGGLALWWPVLNPDAGRRLRPPVQIGYLFLSTILPTIPSAYLTFADYPAYRLYELAVRVGPLTAREDHQVAGLLMKLAADPILWVAMGIIFFRWQDREERVALTARREAADSSRHP